MNGNQLLLEFGFDHFFNIWSHILFILPDGLIDPQLDFAIRSLLLELDLMIYHLVYRVDEFSVLLLLNFLYHLLFRFRFNLRLQRPNMLADHVVNLLSDAIVEACADAAEPHRGREPGHTANLIVVKPLLQFGLDRVLNDLVETALLELDLRERQLLYIIHQLRLLLLLILVSICFHIGTFYVDDALYLRGKYRLNLLINLLLNNSIKNVL